MPHEPLQTIINRVDAAIDNRINTVTAPFIATTITLRIDDVQRLLHAAIWGDDA